jgi:class 3 adenylate cyclase
MLFADVKGYARLTDEQVLNFTRGLFAAVAACLDAHTHAVLDRNSWGDGVYAVFAGASEAADCALDIQEACALLDRERLGVPADTTLRVSAHVGPVFPFMDPIRGVASYIGSHVSRTARIEPVTPPGAVYVTQAFAAALELAASNLRCDYVGHMPTAKDYGRLRMYRLRRSIPLPPTTP